MFLAKIMNEITTMQCIYTPTSVQKRSLRHLELHMKDV